MEKLKIAVIDASETHRKQLENLIKNNSSLELIGSYRNAIQAKGEHVNQLADLIFLDVEMPLINGFDLLDFYKDTPEIILISDKAEYAVKAFEYNVTDYLLKPLNKERFTKAITRVKNNLKLKADSQNNAHLFVKSNFRKVKINFSDIKWIEALGDYIKLVTKTSNHVVLSSMKAFEKQLPTEQFIRIHKSYIINVDRVENLNHAIVEVDGKQMPISRKRRPSLMNALGI